MKHNDCEDSSGKNYSTLSLVADTVYYHTTKTIFGKDQRMPTTGCISYPTLSTLRRIISSSECVFNVNAHVFPCVSHSLAVTLVDFSRKRGSFGRVGFACFCAYFQQIL